MQTRIFTGLLAAFVYLSLASDPQAQRGGEVFDLFLDILKKAPDGEARFRSETSEDQDNLEKISGPAAKGRTRFHVDGVAIGEKFPSRAEFNCHPSDQFYKFEICRSSVRRSMSGSTTNIRRSALLSDKEAVVYINKEMSPITLDAQRIAELINHTTGVLGHPPSLRRIRLPDGQRAIIGVWGNLSLDRLEAAQTHRLASGQNVRQGYLVDFLGDFNKSAKSNLPVYALSGQDGYVLRARYNRATGKGELRVFATNPALYRTPSTTAAFSTQLTQETSEGSEDRKQPLEGAKKTIDEIQREQEEARRLAEEAKKSAEAAQREQEEARRALLELRRSQEETKKTQQEALRLKAIHEGRQKCEEGAYRADKETRERIERDRATVESLTLKLPQHQLYSVEEAILDDLCEISKDQNLTRVRREKSLSELRGRAAEYRNIFKYVRNWTCRVIDVVLVDASPSPKYLVHCEDQTRKFSLVFGNEKSAEMEQLTKGQTIEFDGTIQSDSSPAQKEYLSGRNRTCGAYFNSMTHEVYPIVPAVLISSFPTDRDNIHSTHHLKDRLQNALEQCSKLFR